MAEEKDERDGKTEKEGKKELRRYKTRQEERGVKDRRNEHLK